MWVSRMLHPAYCGTAGRPLFPSSGILSRQRSIESPAFCHLQLSRNIGTGHNRKVTAQHGADDVPRHYVLVYSSTLQKTMAWAYPFSTAMYCPTILFCMYKISQMNLTFSMDMLTEENLVVFFAGGLSAVLFFTMRRTMLNIFRRIYYDEVEGVFIGIGNTTFLGKRKVVFTLEDVTPASSVLLPGRVIKVKGNRHIVGHQDFITPYYYNLMFGHMESEGGGK